MINFKHIHIGNQIKKISELQNITLERACKFHKCNPTDIEEMYDSSSLDSDVLLKWSKLLKYNVFMFYHTHLQIYSPSSATTKIQNNESTKTQSKNEIYFRKNLYSPELIQWLLAKIEEKELSVNDIIEKYNIPKTTIYRWKKKAQQNKYNTFITSPKKNNTIDVDYKLLYTEFVKELDALNLKERRLIINNIKLLDNENLKYQTLYEINKIIKENMKSSNSFKTLNTYDSGYIKKILSYQKEYNLSNSAVCQEYKLSRNTIAKWREIFS